MLNELRVAILVADGFEQVEMVKPRAALQDARASTKIVSPAKGTVQGWNHHDKADRFEVDVPLESADAKDFDALLLPGGVANPDQLRMLPGAVKFVREFFEQEKPVAVICHGPWTLVEAGVVDARRITSWPSLKTDLINAGADWVDQEVVVDGTLVSSRKPDDIPAFNREMLKVFDRGAGSAAPGAQSSGREAGERGREPREAGRRLS